MNGYEEKIKDRLFLEVCNAAGREEWDGLAHQQKENLMLVCRLSGYDEKFQRDCGLVTRDGALGDRRRGAFSGCMGKYVCKTSAAPYGF